MSPEISVWSSTAGEGGGAGSVDMVTFFKGVFFFECNKTPPVINLKGARQAMMAMLTLMLPSTVVSTTKPHIVFIMGDDAGWNDFGFTKGIFANREEYTGVVHR